MSNELYKPWNLEKAIRLAKEYKATHGLYQTLYNSGESDEILEPVAKKLGEIYIALTGEMSLWSAENMAYYKAEMKRRDLG